MSQFNVHMQSERIKGFIDLITVFPSSTRESRRQDERYRQQLLAELAELQEQRISARLNALTALCRAKNQLTPLKRPKSPLIDT